MNCILLLQNDAASTGIRTILVGLTIIGLAIWYAKRDKTLELFKKYAEDNQFQLTTRASGVVDPNLPCIEGSIDGYDVAIAVQRKSARWIGKGKYSTFMIVHGKKKTGLSFGVRRNNFAELLISDVVQLDIQTGHEEFDRMFTLTSNNDAAILRIFDHHLCSDFVNNPQAFSQSGISYRNDYVEFREEGMALNQAQMNRFTAIMEFMVHLCEIIETRADRVK